MTFYGLAFNFIIDALFSWGRMFIALFISIAISIAIGVYAALSPRAEKIILPVTDILQTIPILAFFPIALVIFVFYLPGYIGINAAVIFLIVTSMVWNIIFGVYESIKTIPREFIEVANLYRMRTIERLRKIFIPAALPRIVQQSILSWSIGLFYLVTSEIFSLGTVSEQVQHGIGVDLIKYAPGTAGGSVQAYLLGIAIFIIFVVLTRFLFFKPLEDYAGRYTRATPKSTGRLARTGMFVSWFSKRVIAQPFSAFAPSKSPAKKKAFKMAGQTPQVQVQEKGFVTGKWIYYAIAAIVILAIVGYIVSVYPAAISLEETSLVALLFSFARVWVAFALITAIAFPLCVYLVFKSRQSSRYVLFFQIIASIPATILLPGIALIFSGLPYSGEFVAMAVFFLSGIWYVIFSIYASTRTLPASIFEVKKLFGIRGIPAWKNIYIKALLPGFITGALTAIAAEWNASIVAEYFTSAGLTGGTVTSSVQHGIGTLLDSALGSNNLALMGVALLNLVVMILLINTFVWKRMYRNVSKIYG